MIKFLLDENISNESAAFLNSLGYDAKTVAHFGLKGAEDVEVVKLAIKEKRILITLDMDFGEIFYFATKKKLWVVILKLRDQTIESVNRNLSWFLETKVLEKKEFKNTLMIIEEGRIKIRRRP